MSKEIYKKIEYPLISNRTRYGAWILLLFFLGLFFIEYRIEHGRFAGIHINQINPYMATILFSLWILSLIKLRFCEYKIFPEHLVIENYHWHGFNKAGRIKNIQFNEKDFLLIASSGFKKFHVFGVFLSVKRENIKNIPIYLEKFMTLKEAYDFCIALLKDSNLSKQIHIDSHFQPDLTIMPLAVLESIK